jgi:hypothetical protein
VYLVIVAGHLCVSTTTATAAAAAAAAAVVCATHSPSPAPIYYTSNVTSNASKATKVGDKVKFTGKISAVAAVASIEGRFNIFLLHGTQQQQDQVR